MTNASPMTRSRQHGLEVTCLATRPLRECTGCERPLRECTGCERALR
jgi:hypothetical protein